MIKKFKRYLLLILFSIPIPIIGIVCSNLVKIGFSDQFQRMIMTAMENKGLDILTHKEILIKNSLENLCKNQNKDDNLQYDCNTYQTVKYLNYASKTTLILLVLFFFVIIILGKISINNRNVVFYVFRPVLILSQFFSAFLVLANAIILTSSIYFLEAFYLKMVHIYLIGLIGLVAIYAIYEVCKKALKPIKSVHVQIIGKLLSKNHNQKIWAFVESISTRMQTTPPDNIIVGLDANFFVTESKVKCLDGELSGKTLFLSLPFCRVLTQGELTAIIGHELGHFIGEDTLWSRKFFPIYRGAIETFRTLYIPFSSKANAFIQLAFMPALYFMDFFMTTFATVERKISRERELNADKMGVSITSAEIMGTSLLKVHLYGDAWQHAFDKLKAEGLKKDKTYNIANLIYAAIQLMPADYKKNEIGTYSTTHPIDSHPPLSTRLKAIGIDLITIYGNELTLPKSDLAIDLVENALDLELQISSIIR